MFTSFSPKALACRVVALAYLLIAIACVGGLNKFMTTDNRGACGVVLIGCVFCVCAFVAFLSVAKDQADAWMSKQAAIRRAQQDLAIVQSQRVMQLRADAYYDFRGAGLSDELANHLAENDVLTVNAALNIECEYQSRGVSYNAELAKLLVSVSKPEWLDDEQVHGDEVLRQIEAEFNDRHRVYVLAGGTAGAGYVYDENRMPWDQD